MILPMCISSGSGKNACTLLVSDSVKYLILSTSNRYLYVLYVECQFDILALLNKFVHFIYIYIYIFSFVVK